MCSKMSAGRFMFEKKVSPLPDECLGRRKPDVVSILGVVVGGGAGAPGRAGKKSAMRRLR